MVKCIRRAARHWLQRGWREDSGTRSGRIYSGRRLFLVSMWFLCQSVDDLCFSCLSLCELKLAENPFDFGLVFRMKSH